MLREGLAGAGVQGYARPEFAQCGKEQVTVRQLLAHQAGLFGFDEPVNAAVVADLALQHAVYAGLATLPTD